MALSIETDRRFQERHVGPDDEEIRAMLGTLGLESLDRLVEATVPASIRLKGELKLPDAVSERELHSRLRALAAQNRLIRS